MRRGASEGCACSGCGGAQGQQWAPPIVLVWSLKLWSSPIHDQGCCKRREGEGAIWSAHAAGVMQAARGCRGQRAHHRCASTGRCLATRGLIPGAPAHRDELDDGRARLQEWRVGQVAGVRADKQAGAPHHLQLLQQAAARVEFDHAGGWLGDDWREVGDRGGRWLKGCRCTWPPPQEALRRGAVPRGSGTPDRGVAATEAASGWSSAPSFGVRCLARPPGPAAWAPQGPARRRT